MVKIIPYSIINVNCIYVCRIPYSAKCVVLLEVENREIAVILVLAEGNAMYTYDYVATSHCTYFSLQIC